MNSFVIRPASIKDISSIVKVRLEAVTEEELVGFTTPGTSLYSSVEKLRETWDNENKLVGGFEVFVAESKGEIIGFIVYNMEECNDNIDNVIVAKEKQGKGVGKALVEYVEELAKSRGFHTITTDTTENAKGVPWKSYGFWKKIGYKELGVRVPTEFDFKVIRFVKQLKQKK